MRAFGNPVLSLRLPLLLLCLPFSLTRYSNAQDSSPTVSSWATTDTTSVEYFLEWSTNPTFETDVGGSGWTSATKYTIGFRIEGKRYYYRVKARNAAGLDSLWSEVVSAIHDATPPEGNLHPLPPETHTQSFEIQCQPTDAVSGVEEVWLRSRYEGETEYQKAPFIPDGASGTWTVTFYASEGDGLYEFYSEVKDRAGNWKTLTIEGPLARPGPVAPEARTRVVLPPHPPVLSCIPDIIISDAEQNQAADLNFFVFSDALDLDEHVRDAYTAKSRLRWSFIETAPGGSIRINRIGPLPSPTVASITNPGAYNLRAAGNWASFRNALWSPLNGKPPYPNPQQSKLVSTLQLFVSDGLQCSSQFVQVTTVDTGAGAATNPAAEKDGRLPQPTKSWTFANGAEGWYWFAIPGIPSPYQSAENGRLEMTEGVDGPTRLVFGSWESPKDPTVPGAVKSRYGCVLRARYKLASSVTGMRCPGVRMRAFWTRVRPDPTLGWMVDFASPEICDLYEQTFSTLNVMYVAGREPGAGKTYTLLYYPQQLDTLMTTNSITYITCDLLDDDYPQNDVGTIYIDQVDVDGFDRPELGAPGLLPVDSLTFRDFSAWERFQKKIDARASTATLVQNAGPAGITIGCGAGTTLWEAGYASPGAGVPLVHGRYYRSLWRVTTSQTPPGDAAPTIRTGYISTRFVWAAQKALEGGGANSTLSAAGSDYEMWVAAPTNLTGSSQTEPMKLRFEAYVLFQPDARGKNVSGTVGCRSVTTEWMPAPP